MKVYLLFRLFVLTNSPLILFSSAATTPSLEPRLPERVTVPTPSEPTCRSCETECQTYDIGIDGGRCKCDADCEVYGDCCGSSSTQRSPACEGTPSPNSRPGPLPSELQFTCQSIFLDDDIVALANESFWMVSQCSSNWLTEAVGEAGVKVMESCLSNSSNLPPVTDSLTGIVYKNQHCALCNRVEDVVAWETSLVCTEYLYNLLRTVSFSEIDPTLFRDQCRPCSYQYPRSLPFTPRACYSNMVDTCLNKDSLPRLTEEAYEDLVDECVNGSYDLRTTFNFLLIPSNFNSIKQIVPVIYRNRACAECNGWSDTQCLRETSRASDSVPLQCIPNILPPTSDPPTTTSSPPAVIDSGDGRSLNETIPEPQLPPDAFVKPPDNLLLPGGGGISFTITLSNFGGGHVTVKTATETRNVTVSCPEGQAAVGFDCRDTLCPENFVSLDGKCFSPANNSPEINDNQSTNASGSGSGFFLDCPTQLVALNDSEFTQLDNKTLLVDDRVMEILGHSADGQPLICPDNITTVQENTTMFFYPAGYLELTYIGCSLSVVGSALVLITYGLFKELRSLPSKILMNLAFSNIVTNLLILVGGPISQAFPIVELCTSVAIALHFFFLAQFAWMSVMSLEVVRKFHRAKKLVMDSKHDKLYLLAIYMLVGWGLPLLITTVSIIVNFTTQGLVLYGVLSDGSLGSCWINHFESALVAFVVPLVLSISFNLVMFVAVSVYIFMASRSQAKLKQNDASPFLRLNIAVFCTTGLTWTFGFVAILAGSSWAWYLFIIFNSTQGFVIFVAFLLTKKTLKLYVNLFTCKRVTVKIPKTLSQAPSGSSSVTGQITILSRTEKQEVNGRVFVEASAMENSS